MTILAYGNHWIVCGSLGCVHRVKGRRLPPCLVPYVDVPYEDVPTDELVIYRAWMTGSDRWPRHWHDLVEIEEILLERADREST